MRLRTRGGANHDIGACQEGPRFVKRNLCLHGGAIQDMDPVALARDGSHDFAMPPKFAQDLRLQRRREAENRDPSLGVGVDGRGRRGGGGSGGADGVDTGRAYVEKGLVRRLSRRGAGVRLRGRRRAKGGLIFPKAGVEGYLLALLVSGERRWRGLKG